MYLIKKIYDRNVRSLSYEPSVVMSDDDERKFRYVLLDRMHLVENDLCDLEVINVLEGIFSALEVEENINLSNMETGSSRYPGRTGSVSFDYSIDGVQDDSNVITYYGSLELNYALPVFKISSENTSLYYLAYKNGDHSLIKYEEKLSDDVLFSRKFTDNMVYFSLEGLDNRLIVQVNGFSGLKNEFEVVDYLRNLNYSYDINDIYNRLCKLSLGNDFSIYSEINLCESKKENNDWKVVNSISIKEGKINNIVRTIGDKTISCDDNGNWGYILHSEDIELTINSGDTVSYNIVAKNTDMMDDYVDMLLKYDVSTARKEVMDTKKLVRQRLGIK